MAETDDPSGANPPNGTTTTTPPATTTKAAGRPGGATAHPIPAGVLTVGVVGVVIVVVIVLVTLNLTTAPKGAQAPPVQPAPSALVKDVTSIPGSVFDTVGDPSVPLLSTPSLIKDGPVLEVRGLPAVVWVGALFCPACAAERWSLVIALGRFGTFEKLYSTTSASTEVFPNTPTFSLDGAVYESSDLALAAVEEYGNEPSTKAPAGYVHLASPNSVEKSSIRAYDKEPWAQSGVLPFVDVANRMVLSGASFTPGLLHGLSMQQIVFDLTQRPGNQVTRALIGAANQITAAICTVIANPPASVCSSPAVKLTSRLVGLDS